MFDFVILTESSLRLFYSYLVLGGIAVSAQLFFGRRVRYPTCTNAKLGLIKHRRRTTDVDTRATYRLIELRKIKSEREESSPSVLDILLLSQTERAEDLLSPARLL
jgi:hypothetical protein